MNFTLNYKKNDRRNEDIDHSYDEDPANSHVSRTNLLTDTDYANIPSATATFSYKKELIKV